MRLTVLIGFVAACFAAPTFADVPATPSPPGRVVQTPPLSVWRLSEAGDAAHLESALACPARFRSYRRRELHVYDRFGLDVSCDYGGPGADFTVYMTRRSGLSIDDAMAEAKREYLQIRAGLHPQPISDTRSADGDIKWQVALYGDDAGRDAIWVADLNGWTLEYRITYRPASEAAALADAAAMTQMVTRSAEAHLGLCAKAQPPIRSGVAIKDAKADKDSALMGAILGGAMLAAGTNGGQALASAPTTWCVEEPVRLGNAGALFWRGVHDNGSDAEVDQLTEMTVGPPPTLTAQNDALAGLVEGHAKDAAKWSATVTDSGHTRIYGYFTGRPSPEALAALFEDIVNGRAKPLIGFGAKGKSVTIEMPSDR